KHRCQSCRTGPRNSSDSPRGTSAGYATRPDPAPGATMMSSMRRLVTTFLPVLLGCASSALSAQPVTFHVVQDASAGTISVLRGGSRDVVLVQNAQERIRPFLHPIMSPDGQVM